MLLREYEAMKIREELAENSTDMSDWLTVEQRFETAFKPTTNNIVRDAATPLNTRQQPAEDISSFALRRRDSLLPFPMADRQAPTG